MKTSPRWLALEIAVPVLLLALWWKLTAQSTSFIMPPLSDVFRVLRTDWMFDRVGTDLVPSLVRLAIGYSLGCLIGVAVGIALGRSDLLSRAFRPTVEFFRFMPPPVTAPIFVVIWGIGDLTKVLFIVFGVMWSVMLNSMDGARSIDPVLLDTATASRMTRFNRFRHVVLPATSPQIFVGLRNGLAVGVIVMAVGEMVGSANGIGFYILNSQRTFATRDMWAGMLVLGLVGFVLNAAFLAIERRVLFWHIGRAEHGNRSLRRRRIFGRVAVAEPGSTDEPAPQSTQPEYRDESFSGAAAQQEPVESV